MYIGTGIDRRDARLKVTGKATYAAEFAMPDLAYAVLVQSTIAAGTVTGFDLARVQAMPGVLAIITPDNAERLSPTPPSAQFQSKPLLQDTDVLYSGQHIGVVVAETFEAATGAADAVKVRYDTGEAITEMRQNLSSAYVPKAFRNGEAEADTHIGDAEAAFARSPVRLEATYVTPNEHHNPMEPHATIAKWDGDKLDRLTVWTATQGISGAQKTLATLFGLKPGNVTVICPYVGGGFGCKGNTWPHVVLAAMAARQVKRPVKLVLTRAQMFSSNGFRPMTIQKMRLSAMADGRLTSIRHDGTTQMSMASLGEFAEPVAMATRMLYACPSIATSHRLVAVNQGLPTYMRAPGEASGIFALESAMDELAVALKMDPLELRLRNHTDVDPTAGKPFASKGLRECYTKGAAAFGWSNRKPEPRSMRNGRMLVGYGMATSTYPTNRMPASAVVRMLADGTAEVRAGTQDIGTGTYTVMAQIAADTLSVPIEQVKVELGDSRFPSAPVSGGSMTVASVMPAVQAAAVTARGELFKLALAQDGAWARGSQNDLRLQNGIVIGPAGQVSVGDLLASRALPFVEGKADAKLGAEAKNYSRHAFGAQFAEVQIDPDLGTIHVTRWVGAFDCGRLMNAKTGRSQLIGGIVFGVGMALFEETLVDAATGRITNANVAEYLMPVNADIPDLQTIVVEAPDTVTSPLGVKGIGELPMVGAAPAVANAIYHATGVRVRDLPIRLDKLLTSAAPV